jgi:phosphate starvation-inducible PhoH-like protein
MNFEKKQSRKEKRASKFATQEPQSYGAKKVKPITALNKIQQQYLNTIRANIITFAIGSAGTGKTYIAASYAAQMLEEGNIDTIVMTRPNVEAGRGFGFLKGELEEKFAPYIEPLLDVLNERLGKSHTEYLVKRGAIQFKPLEFLRGKTFSNCLYILDEAQNTTPSQMKLFLSRIGEDTKVIIDGDIEQKDINGICGLEDAVNRLRNIDNIGIVEFTVDDVVRSGICKEILLAYRN